MVVRIISVSASEATILHLLTIMTCSKTRHAYCGKADLLAHAGLGYFQFAEESLQPMRLSSHACSLNKEDQQQHGGAEAGRWQGVEADINMGAIV